MSQQLRIGAGAIALLLVTAATSAAARAAREAPAGAIDVEIPYTQFVLDNGLTLIVHEDHKAPIVAVNVWYHVGSKNEVPGRTGFAHLFEHLMFNGSEHFDDDYFQGAERLGATDLNGTTNEDRTNYFQTVPTSALDAILWLESDRMGHMLGAVTQEKLDEQRGVVQNEKRQFENQPYAVAWELITKATYPAHHPYSWTVIGSMEDLEAAELEDVHAWFERYYGAANAVIVIAGDIDPETAKRKVEKYFGDIPSGPPVARHEVWIAPLDTPQRQLVHDRVPHARLYKIWNVPQAGSVDHDMLDLATMVLGSGKTSRLYKRLVYDDQIASDISVYLDSREIGSQFHVEATAQPGVELERIERAIDEELERFLDDGPAAAELERVTTDTLAGFIRGAERIGGFGGKSDVLANGAVYVGDPAAYRTTLRRFDAATPAEVQRAARAWLGDGVYTLEVLPFPEYATSSEGADRSGIPAAGEPPAAEFVELRRSTLANGLELVLAERHAMPLVSLTLLLDAGYASDRTASPGTASLAMNMLDEGTRKRTALAISDELDRLGATLGTGSNLDMSTVSLTALTARLEPSLDIFADVALDPAFPAEELERLRKLQLSSIQGEKKQPFTMALRLLPVLMYGREHAYGVPFTGSGYEETVQALDRDDLVAFHRTWFKPDNATLVVVGDITLERLKPLVEARFGKWEAGDVPSKNIAQVSLPEEPVIYLVDKPGAIQSVILAGHVAPPRGHPEDIAIDTMNEILGGSFTSRLNMNLREDKHWSYGAGSVVIDASGQRPFVVFAPVQTDKTKESLAEVMAELRSILKARPVTEGELGKIKEKRVLELPGTWETNGEVAGAIVEIERFGLGDDYFDLYPGRVRGLTQAQVAAATGEVLRPENLIWVVIGDRAQVEAGLRELDLGEVRLIDADGKPVGK